MHGRCSCLLSSRSNTHSLSTQLNSPWNHPVFCYIMCARDLQRDSCGFSRYLLSSTDENIFGLDSEGLAVCKGRRDPVKNMETSSEACQGHARFKQNRDASCHQVSFLARQGAEGNSRHSDRNISLFPS